MKTMQLPQKMRFPLDQKYQAGNIAHMPNMVT